MLTDVVGSTRLRVDLGDAMANELTAALEASTETVVGAHGGRTVKHLGDGTLAVFGAAVDALAASTDVHAAIDALEQPGIDAVKLRVGLAAGDIEDTGHDVHGRAVVAAARLCDLADPGQVLTTDIVLDLAAGRLEHATTSHGHLELKGLPEAVAVSALDIAPNASSPTRTALVDSADRRPIVGRDDELRMLETAWETGEGGVVVTLPGEAGLGKTALLAEFAERVGGRGAAVFYGAADGHSQTPFQPWPQALSSVLEPLPLGVLAATIRDDGPALAPLLSRTRERLRLAAESPTDWADHLPMTADALVRVLARTPGVGRRVVILDDLHLCSADAARLLPFVAERLVDVPVMLVVAYRESELDAQEALSVGLSKMSVAAPTVEVALHPLTSAQISELLGDAASADQVEAVRRRSGGNPFYVLAFAHRMGEVPETGIDEVRADEVLDDGIAQLGPDATEVLAAMALIGGEIDTYHVLDVVDLPERVVVETIDHAIAAGILTEGTSDAMVRFTHGLFAEAALRRVRGPRRSLLHTRIADALEASGGSARLVSRHLLAAASPRHFDRVMRTALQASSEALDAFAYDDTRLLIEHALDYAAGVGRQRDPAVAPLLSNLSYALYQRGDLEGRRRVGHDLHELAVDLGDAEMLRHAARAIAGFPKAGEPDPSAEHALLVAIDATPTHRPAAKAELLSMLAYYRAINEGRGMEADELAREAVAFARAADEPFELAEALAARSFVMTGAPPIDQHLDVLAELAELITRLPSAADRDRHEQYVLRQRAPLLLRMGNRSGFDDDHEELRRIATERHSWVAAATVAMWDGMMTLSAGRYDGAEGCFEHMAAVGDREPNFVNSYLAALFVIRHLQGRAGELREIAETTVASSPALVAFRPCVAVAQLAAGDGDAASRTYRDLADVGFRTVPRDFSETFSLHFLTYLALRLGEPDDLEQLERRLAPYEGQLVVGAWGICTLGAADRARAALLHRLGDEERAGVLLRSADLLEEAVGDVTGRRLLDVGATDSG